MMVKKIIFTAAEDGNQMKCSPFNVYTYIMTIVIFLGNEMAIKTLVSGPNSANIQNDSKFTPLHLAAQNGISLNVCFSKEKTDFTTFTIQVKLMLLKF